MSQRLPVLIVAPIDDIHARAVFDRLERWHVVAKWVDFAALDKNVGLTLSLNGVVRGILNTAANSTKR